MLDARSNLEDIKPERQVPLVAGYRWFVIPPLFSIKSYRTDRPAKSTGSQMLVFWGKS